MNSRKIFVVATIAMLVFSLIAVSAKPGKATIHVQTFGYEGRDLLKLNVEITGEDSDSFYITLNPGMLNKLSKQINVEKLPITAQGDVYVVPKAYLTEIGTNEYLAVVPNDVCKIKWNVLDKIEGKGKGEIVSVIVMYKGVKNPAMLNKYGTITYEFLAGDGAAMDVAVGNIKALSEEPGILFVEDDAIVYACLSDSVPLINADDAWSAGYDGTGVTICIVDTGIDANHCDFPTWKMVGWKDCVNSQSNYYDDHGHGTHCASIAAGYDAPKGVAPGAYLMGAKVLNSSGSGTTSQITAGIEWAVYNGADIISMSLGGAGGDGTSTLAQKSNWAVDQGVVVVVAAGNDGACCTIGTPGDATKVITVASSTKTDSLSSFSSRGPTTDGRTKPDITAPGSSIYAADSGTSCSDTGMSGTSMATPHIAGVCALMLDANGSVTPLQVKNVLGYTAIDKYNTGKDALWGWGRVDAYAAVNQIMSNPNVTPPADASDIGCTCGGGSCLGTTLVSLFVLLGVAIRRR
ncbi:MAG: S8 family serine peptidase [Theionarchaea archaeon]|nr:S8 family serine peptidase [Theionarchaea archaeon]